MVRENLGSLVSAAVVPQPRYASDRALLALPTNGAWFVTRVRREPASAIGAPAMRTAARAAAKARPADHPRRGSRRGVGQREEMPESI